MGELIKLQAVWPQEIVPQMGKDLYPSWNLSALDQTALINELYSWPTCALRLKVRTVQRNKEKQLLKLGVEVEEKSPRYWMLRLELTKLVDVTCSLTIVYLKQTRKKQQQT